MSVERVRQQMLEGGYIGLSDVDEIIARIGERMANIDEHVAREYLLDSSGGIEDTISAMCKRLHRLFQKIAAEELARQRELIAGDGRKPL